VAYSSDGKGNFEIFVKQLSSGGGELQLTNDGQQNTLPSWSPDGQRIAYHSEKRGGIWVMSAFGGAPKQLTETGTRPAWSPDGSLIAFQSGGAGEIFASRAMPPSTIWVVPSDGGTPRQITQQANPPGGHSFPSWSPDGKRIAFQVSNYFFSTIWTMSADGSNLKRIIKGDDPIYSADGKYIYFLNWQSANGELSSMELSPDGDPVGEPTTLLQPGAAIGISGPAISRDGNRLVYSARRTVSNLWSLSLLRNGDSAGAPAVFSTDTSQRNSVPRFSPDGRKIALNRWRQTMSADVWIADADGKNLTQVTNNPGIDSEAGWLPGGDKVAFITDRDNKHLTLWSLSLATGKQEPLLDLGEDMPFAVVSPDGNQVAYQFIHNGIMNVWIAGIRDGQRRQLTFDREMAGFPCWSPDGKWIAYEVKRGEDDLLMVIPSAGGEPTRLTFDTGKSWPHSFSPDGDSVYFAGERNGIWNIYSISVSTKIQKQLTNYSKLNAFVRYPALSRNQIVYEYAEITGNIWMLDLK
jgi:Tol biopolymer transport system component